MKKKYLTRIFQIAVAGLFPLFMKAQNPTYLLELRNDVQVSSTIFEFDIFLVRTGTTTFEYAAGQYGIEVNSLIKNGGTITASIIAGSSDPLLISSNQNPTSITFTDASNAVKIAGRTPPGAGNGTMISNVSPGTRICRVRLTNTVDFGQYKPDLTWTTTNVYPTQVYAYVGGTNTLVTTYSNHTTSNLANPVLNMVTSTENLKNNDYELRVYPNPASEKVTIDYKLFNNSHITLSVFDSNGRQVEQLVNEIQQAGNYSLPWISVSRSDGIYIIKLQTGSSQRISRITLIH